MSDRDLDTIAKAIEATVRELGMQLFPAMPEARGHGAMPLAHWPAPRDASEFIHMAAALGVSVVYVVGETAEASGIAEMAAGPQRESAEAMLGRVTTLRAAWVHEGVLHCWSVTDETWEDLLDGAEWDAPG